MAGLGTRGTDCLEVTLEGRTGLSRGRGRGRGGWGGTTLEGADDDDEGLVSWSVSGSDELNINKQD